MNIIFKNEETNYFNNIKHIDENGNEYWNANELMNLLNYSSWQSFIRVINKALLSCRNSSMNVNDHFIEIKKKRK